MADTTDEYTKNAERLLRGMGMLDEEKDEKPPVGRGRSSSASRGAKRRTRKAVNTAKRAESTSAKKEG